MTRRRNVDERLRRLERAAAAGDLDAEARLWHERRRSGADVVTPESRRLELARARDPSGVELLVDAMTLLAWSRIENWWEEGVHMSSLGGPRAQLAFATHALESDWRQASESYIHEDIGFFLEENPEFRPPSKPEAVSLWEQVVPCAERRRLLAGVWQRMDEADRRRFLAHFGDWVENGLDGPLPCVSMNPRRRNGDDDLRRLERAVVADPSDAEAAYRFGVAWRRAGRAGEWPHEWPQILIDMMRPVVAGIGEEGWGERAAQWVRLVTIMGLSPAQRMSTALDEINTAIRSRRSRVTPAHVYRLLMPYWNLVSVHVTDVTPLNQFGVVATWWSAGSDIRLLTHSGEVRRAYGRDLPPGGAHAVALWSGIDEGPDRVTIGFNWIPRHVIDRLGVERAENNWLPGPAYPRSRLVMDAWHRAAERSAAGITTQQSWQWVRAPLDLTIHEVVHFMLEHELREAMPELLVLPPATSATTESVTADVERMLLAANGRRSTTTLGLEDLREAVRLALARPEPVAVAVIGGLSGVGFSALTLYSGSSVYGEAERPSGFHDVAAEILSSTGRRGRSGTRITLGLVAADDSMIAIGVKAATGNDVAWGAIGAVARAWSFGNNIYRPTLRAWMQRQAANQITISRGLAEEWAGLSS